MTDPTSYAAGIEDAARVVEGWQKSFGSRDMSHVHNDMARAIRKLSALAPEHGGGSGENRLVDKALLASGEHVYDIAPAPPAAPSGWREIASAPKRRKVIGGFHNELGNWRTVVARYYPAGTLETEGDHLADDEGFAPEGWYEESETQDVILPIKLTHWQPLPAPPPPVPAQVESEGLGPCPICSGDCGSANPPVMFCPMQRIRELEGEVARVRSSQLAENIDTLDRMRVDAEAHADRLTHAAQAARNAGDNLQRDLELEREALGHMRPQNTAAIREWKAARASLAVLDGGANA